MIADPFPHVVLPDLFERWLLDMVRDEFPSPDKQGWRCYGNDKEMKLEGPQPLWGPATERYFVELRRMTDEFGAMFGMQGLSMEMAGGGYHLIPPGGFLGVHTDFNRSPRTRLFRRLNAITYLNDDDPGGHLELWDDDRCVVDIAPMMGVTAIFETSDRSWHGHPKPTTGWRKSVAAYFFSPEPPPGYRADHSTVWHA